MSEIKLEEADYIGVVMSNFDHRVEEDLAERLREGDGWAHHTAWNFCGDVWWEDGQYHEKVYCFRAPMGTYSADNLKDLMREVNDNFGWK